MKRYRSVKLDTGDGNIDMSEVTGEAEETEAQTDVEPETEVSTEETVSADTTEE